MGLINLPNSFSPNTTIDSSDVNDNFSTIVNTINGNLDANNLASGVITASKIADGTITADKLVNNTLTDQEFSTNVQSGWNSYYGSTAFPAPNTVTCNGNRSYDLVFNSVDLTGYLSPGMRLQLTRTVSAPTKCTDLESGSSQYYSKSSPAGMTFTDDFVVSAWIKQESYADTAIASRFDSSSGWIFKTNTSGQVSLIGLNGGAANQSSVTSYQSVPLGKWVHVTAQLDMSTFTATSTTSYVMIDGVDVPASVARGGTNPTALVQAGNLNIGAQAGTALYDGKIAQVAIYSAKVTQANIRATISQGLSGSETSLVSAYSFNNTLNDLNTGNANNLTANGSAVATNSDSPFALDPQGTPTGTTEYAIITKTAFSTNTTVTVQVPEGGAIPTSGGVSTVRYSTQKVPYGFPADRGRWTVDTYMRSRTSAAGTANTYQNQGLQLTVPAGAWHTSYQLLCQITHAGATNLYFTVTLSTASNTNSDSSWGCRSASTASSQTQMDSYVQKHGFLSPASATVYYLNIAPSHSSTTVYMNDVTSGDTSGLIRAELALL